MRKELSSQWQDLGEFIRGQREITQLSLRRLAELAEVSNPYLSQIERGLRRPSAEILKQIAKALQISAESLYVRAGILDADTIADTSVREAILRDPYLTTDQKHTLLTVYESFVAHAVDAAALDAVDADHQDQVTVMSDAQPTAGSKAHESRPTA
jgi:transcriptional regulator with XRE-family HTH domain